MSTTGNGLVAYRRTVLYLSKLFFLALGSLPVSWAAPFRTFANTGETRGVHPKKPDDPALWLDMTVAVFLVLLGGIFAGLTIALMGQDEINLQVVSRSGIGAERKHAGRVLRLIKRGKHWVLVTLLLSNVITNETLPIILDRSLGGGWPAVVGSTVAIVIFGEIIPQSVCVRFGLAIGAWMSPFVLILMYLESPIAWPTAKLLDRLIGQEHGTTYSKAGLKTLVTIHKTFGDAGERLNEDEVTIIGAVLELKNKALGSIMTPMEDVFTMSLDTVLDEKTMEAILSAGYSRIPIHAPDEPNNFVGMLLVKMLITYDPEDARPVGDFALATLPETAPDTSCLDILNFFQEGKSHMVLVSENPGENEGAVGVLTLEDVIEELIGEEIIDESDVFVDVHKAIRRLAPAPRNRLRYDAAHKEFIATRSRDGSVSEFETRPADSLLAPIAETRDQTLDGKPREHAVSFAASPKHATFLVRRRSSGIDGSGRETITKRTDSPELRQHLKHLGPSNLASRPRSTRFTNVKIKPGANEVRNGVVRSSSLSQSLSHSTGGVGEGVLRDAALDARDGVQALHQGYGTIENRPLSVGSRENPQITRTRPDHSPAVSDRSASTLNSLPDKDEDKPRISRNRTPRGTTRSGSITENIVEYNGFRKVVLDISSSSDEAAAAGSESQDANRGNSRDTNYQRQHDENAQGSDIKKKKKKKKKTKSKTGDAAKGDEDRPLLE